MKTMPHGYTNRSVTDGRVVRKTFAGPDAQARQAREELALRRLAGLLPVPTLLDSAPGTTTTAYVPGVPAQEAIEAGSAESVLLACGRLLARLQALDPRTVFDGAAAAGGVLVHHDFGPNNVVMREGLGEAALLCDWEWVTSGPWESDVDTDLAWAEFIVRTHHPDAAGALPALFEGYGSTPSWELRRRAMTRRAVRHREFVRRWHGDAGAATWDGRIAAIQRWQVG